MIKFTSKVEYSVLKHEDLITGKSHVAFRYLDLTITAGNMEVAEKLWNECAEYLENKLGTITIVGCPSSDSTDSGKYYYYDCIVVYDRDEFEELKDLIKEWKQSRKIRKVA